MSVVIETRCLSPDARLPVGSEQAEQPGKSVPSLTTCNITKLIQVDPAALTLTVVLTVSLCLFQNRRWSSAQAREFLHLHSTLALITLQADLTPHQTHGETRSRFPSIEWFYSFFVQTLITSRAPCAAPGGFKLQMSGVPSSALLPLHPDILASLFTPDGQPYLQEVTPIVFALI